MNIDYEADLADKLARNTELWEMLASHAAAGVAFNLDFFFYADSKVGGESLQMELSALGYQATSERSGTFRNRLWAVTGSTPPMTLTRSEIDEWTRRMVDIARRCQSQFDGWGTALPA